MTRVRTQAEQTSQSGGRSVGRWAVSSFGVTQKSTHKTGAASNASEIREM